MLTSEGGMFGEDRRRMEWDHQKESGEWWQGGVKEKQEEQIEEEVMGWGFTNLKESWTKIRKRSEKWVGVLLEYVNKKRNLSQSEAVVRHVTVLV